MDYDQFTKRVYCAIHQIKKRGLQVGFSFNSTVDRTGVWRSANKTTRHPLFFFIEGRKIFVSHDTTSSAISRRLGIEHKAIRAFQAGYVGSFSDYATDYPAYFEFGRVIRDKVIRLIPMYEPPMHGIW